MKFVHGIYSVILLIICCAVAVLEGSKILVLFPMPFKSHVRTFSVLVEELAKRGHEVTMVTCHPIGKPLPNYREILLDGKMLFGDATKDYNFTEWIDMSSFSTMILRWTVISEWVEKALASAPIQSLVQSQDRYDVVMGEFFVHQEAFLAFGHRFNAPTIELCPQHLPLSTASLVGNPYSFSYLPDHEVPYVESLSFMERLHNMIFSLFKMTGIHWYEIPKHETFVESFLRYPGSETRPPLKDLIKEISLVLVNSHFSFHPPRPVSPNVVEIGGFHLKPPAKLPSDLQPFMDAATEGVVLVSFGSQVKTHMLSKEREEAFISVFKTIKQKVLWRWDNADAYTDTSKVLIREWLPQQSVLAHPNCVLFLTHGGIASLIEAVHFGVPVIGFPFIVDQFHNVEYMQKSGIGLKSSIHQLNHDQLLRAVTTVLSTPSFRARAKEQSRLMRDQPESHLDRAVFWVEYIIRHKGAHHLKPASVHLPFYQYLLLDVTASIAVIFVLLVFILWRLSKFLCFKSIGRSKVHEKTH